MTQLAGQASHGAASESILGDAEKLARRFDDWLAARGEVSRVEHRLAWSKARSRARSEAVGRVRLDEDRSEVEFEVAGFARAESVDLWAIPIERGAPERLLTSKLARGAAKVTASLPEAWNFARLDRWVVTVSGADPLTHGLLHGSPSLFERLAALPPGTFEQNEALDRLVTFGEQLFFEETFDGNGRTCGTCHPAENDLTLDPEFIATLPPDDPLFVAEFTPALDSAQNGGLIFEDPERMRAFGLIVVNIDGFEDPAERFVLRGVMHLSGLGRTMVPAPNQIGAVFKEHALGWSGDGSPGNGTLHEFSEGAVTQHFPKTMGRVPGVDFRLPTTLESLALEAFMLSIGREDESAFSQTLRDPDAQLGKADFLLAGQCSGCHQNAGANTGFALFGTGTIRTNTGVERFSQRFQDAFGARPVDGGFGLRPGGKFAGGALANPDGSFGSRSFEVQSLIESASTLPSFHSHPNALPNSPISDGIEGAVRFYTRDEVLVEGGFQAFLDEPGVRRVGRFLRAIGAIDEFRSIGELAGRAQRELLRPTPNLARATRLVELAAFECRDAHGLLEPVGLHPIAQSELLSAALEFDLAQAGTVAARTTLVASGLDRLQLARAEVVH